MATHSSVPAWRIPGMGEPGGLPSMGSHSRTRLKRLSSSSMSGWLKKPWVTTVECSNYREHTQALEGSLTTNSLRVVKSNKHKEKEPYSCHWTPPPTLQILQEQKCGNMRS